MITTTSITQSIKQIYRSIILGIQVSKLARQGKWQTAVTRLSKA